MIVGATIRERPSKGKFGHKPGISDRIIFFDFIKCQWYVVAVRLPTLIGNKNAFVMSKNEMFIDIFGYDRNVNDRYNGSLRIDNRRRDRVCSNIHYRLCISTNIDWKLQRIVWIGFYKNDAAQKNACYIALLPKDVVKYVLSFVSGYCLMQQA